MQAAAIAALVVAAAAAPALSVDAAAQAPDPAPTVSGVTSPDANGTYRTGQIVAIEVEFSAPVEVSGTPRLELATDPVRYALYANGSGTGTLEFWYTVQPGDTAMDLDHAGNAALSAGGGGAAIRAAQGGAGADLGLPDAGALASSKDIRILGAPEPKMSVVGEWAYQTNWFRQLGAADVIDIDNKTFAVVATYGDDRLQLFLIRDDGSLARGGDRLDAWQAGFPRLYQPEDVRAFRLNGSTYAVAAVRENAPQRGGFQVVTLDGAGAGTIGVVDAGDEDGFYHTVRPFRVDTFELGNETHRKTYAVAVSHHQDHVRMINIDANGNATWFATAPNGANFPQLADPYDVDAFEIGDKTYAIVASLSSHAVQLIRIYENGTLLGTDWARDTDTPGPVAGAPSAIGPFPSLRNARAVDAFEMDNRTYAIVASSGDRGVQLIRIHENGTLVGTSWARDTDTAGPIPNTPAIGPFPRLDFARDIDTFKLGTATYAVVASTSNNNERSTGSIQLVYIHKNGTLEGAGSARENEGTFYRLEGAETVAAFKLGAAVHTFTTSEEDGVSVIRISPTLVTGVSASTHDDTCGIGCELNVAVAFDGPVRIQGPPPFLSLVLDNGGAEAAKAQYLRGNTTSELVFNYTVRPGDLAAGGLGYAGPVALATRGNVLGRVNASADLELPAPGADGSLRAGTTLVVDTQPAAALSVSSALPSGTYPLGYPVPITVEFDKPVAVQGPPPTLLLALGGGENDRRAEYVSGSGTRLLEFEYTVQPGDSTGRLDYANETALSPGSPVGRIVDVDWAPGYAASLDLPAPGAPGSLGHMRGIAIDSSSAAAYATGVSTDASGAYRQGRTIDIIVQFSAPVDVVGTPLLSLATAPPRDAAYVSGGGTDRLTFRYTVQPGDVAVAGLDYRGRQALSLAGGAASIRTASDGTTDAVLALPEPGKEGSLGRHANITVDTSPPSIEGIASPSLSGTYGTGRIVDVTVSFDEPVHVEGIPAIGLATVPERNATYASGSGTNVLSFLYTVQPGDSAAGLAYTSLPMQQGGNGNGNGGAAIRDAAGNLANMTAPGTAQGGLPPPAIRGDIEVHGAPLPVLAAAGDIRGNADDARAVAAFETGGRTYAAVASEDRDGVQLVRVHGNGTLSTADWINGSQSLSDPNSLAVLNVGGSTYIVATSWTNRSVQLIGVGGDSGSLSDVGRATQGQGFALGGPVGVASFEAGGRAYVIVASAWPTSGVEVIRVNASGGLEQVQWIPDSPQVLLDGAFGVDVFEIPVNDTHTATYAIVAAGQGDDGVQLFRVNASDGTLAAARQLGNTGALELNGARDVDAFRTANNRTYAIVASYNDDGVQLVRVHENGALEAAGRLGNSDGLALNGAIAAEAFAMGGRTYAAVASELDSGVQLVRVHEEDGTLSAAGVARDGPDFPRLGGARDIDVFGMDGRTYAIVPSRHDNGVQLIRLSPPSVASVTASQADGGPLATGRQLNVTVAFDAPVTALGPPPSLMLAFDGGDRAAEYLDGNGTERLVFNYTLRAGDGAGDGLRYAGPAALATRGVILDARVAEGAAAADLELPDLGAGGRIAGSGPFRAVDTGRPYVESVRLPDGGYAYGTGRIVVIEAVLDRAVTMHGGGEPRLELDTDPPRTAAYAGGNGTDRLEFRYAVMPGDWADRLDYAGTGALSLPEGGYVSYGNGMTAADLQLLFPPGAPGSLGAPGSDPITVIGGPLPILRPAGAAVHGQGNYSMLFNAIAVDTIEADGGGGAHALVAATGDLRAAIPRHGLQLVRVHPDGTLSAGGSLVVTGTDPPLSQPRDVAAFEMGGRGRALVSAGSSISLVDMYPNGTIALNRSATEGDDGGFDELAGASGAAVFRAGNQTRAIVASSADHGLQLVGILPNGTLVHNGSAANGTGGLVLSRANDIDMLGTDGRGAGRNSGNGPPRAIVATGEPGGLQLVSIHPNGTISHNGSATDGEGGFETLGSASSVAAFEMGGLDYAVATSQTDDGLQLVRIHPNGTLAAAGSATNGTDGFDTLDFAQDVAVFGMGGRMYALAASYGDDGLQLARIDRDGSLVAAGSARDGIGGFNALLRVDGVDVFDAGGRTYAMAAAPNDNAVQLVRLSPASVAGVSSPAGGGPHAASAMINVTVAFDELIVLQDLPQRPPSLLLSLDGSYIRAAPYLSGNGTNKLVFNYTVLPGDATAPAGSVLEYAHAGALASRGAITDMRGDPADLGLPEPGAPGSLSGEGSITIDTVRPRAVSISSPNASGMYKQGDGIHITVGFSEAVDVTGTPVLELALDGEEGRSVDYSFGTGTGELTFVYTVRPGDEAAGLDHAGAGALSLPGEGASISDAAGNDANTTLPAAGRVMPLGGSGAIAIDGVRPRVESVSSPNASGTYAQGDDVHIEIGFSEAVDVAGTPVLELALDGKSGSANYSSRTGTGELTFVYTVRAGDEAAELAHAGALTLAGGSGTSSSSIRDAAGNDANATLPAAGRGLPLPLLPSDGSGAIAIDGVRPRVAGVAEAGPGKGAPYRQGETIRIAVDFGEPVEPSAGFNSSLRLALAGGATAYAWYEGLSGDRRALVHSYTVRDGDAADPLDYDGGPGALSIAGGSVTDAPGNPAAGAPALPEPGGNGSLAASGIRIDTERPRVLSAAPMNASGTYGADSDIGIAVLFGEVVHVKGTPRIALDTGATDRQAVYASGSGTARLVFVYAILPGDRTPALEYAGTGALDLNDGTIRDAAGNDANTTLPAPGSPQSLGGSGRIIDIDAAAPPPPDEATRAASVSSPDGSGPHGPGSTVNITVHFTRPVRAVGDLALALSTVPPRSAVHASASAAAAGGGGATSSEMLFLYAVQPGDSADRLDYPGTDSLSAAAGGGFIRDADGNAAVLALPPPGSQRSLHPYNIGIDGVAPAVTDVAPRTANGTYGIGSRIDIAVVFNEAVYVAGSPRIGLDTGGEAVYASGNGTVALVFAYTVLPGHRTDGLDYAGAGALDLNGGTIRDAAGNDADTTLPAPGAPGSLGASADIAIDTTAAPPPPDEPARVLRVSSPDAGGTYGAGSTVNITVYFSRSVSAEGDIVLALSTVPPRSAVRADDGGAAATSHELALVYAVQPGDSAARLDYAGTGALSVASAGGSVRDTDGNDAVLALPAPGSHQSLSGSGIAIGGGGGGRDPSPAPDAPAVVSVHVRGPAGPYTAGETIAIGMVFSAPVSVGAPGGGAAGAGAGAPYLELRTGSAGARAEYVSGSGTDTIRFEYTVRGGDLAGRLSYASAGALRLNGSTITAVAAAGSGPAASTILPAPGAPDSLSAPGSPVVRIDPEPGRPVLAVGILDDEVAGLGGVRTAALAAAYAFNERQGRSPDALLLNATAYGVGATTGSAAAEALQAAHAGSGAGPSIYVGPSTDRGLHAAMPYAADNNIVLVSAGSTAPSLAVEGDTVFRFLPGGRLDAEALARLARAADAQSMVAVLENVTHGPPTAAGADLTDATPPPQDRFSRAFDAALDYAGVPTLSGTITLEGGAAAAGGGGGTYEAAAAAEALDAAVVQAARPSPAAVVYTGSPQGLAALAAEASASYPALASATWIASGQSAGSSLLAGDGPAAAFAAQAGLQSALWSVPANDLARAVDSLLPPGADAAARHRAYAAYDAMGVIGAAAALAAADTRGDTPDAAAVAELIPGTAAAYDGALGDIALDYAGDLWVPAVYDLWTVGAAQPVSGAEAEWTLQQGALDETRACSIALTRAKIDYGPIDSGQTSRPHLQTIVNTGQLPFSRVDLTATPWHVDSPGNCAPGGTPSLPVGLSEIRTVAGGAFSDLAGSGTVLAQGLEAGSRSPLWYRLSLAGYADLPQAEITQCATYVVRCG